MESNLNKNPWPGLASYEESGYTFSGRQRATAELINIIESYDFVTLYGKTGIGKTSLLKAGVFPILRQRGYVPIYIRLGQMDEKESLTKQIIDFLTEAVDVLRLDIDSLKLNENYDDVDYLWKFFHTRLFSKISDEETRIIPVLILDQFEELFVKRPKDVKRLLKQIRLLICNNLIVPNQTGWYPTYDCRFLISIREDCLFYLEDVADKEFLPELKTNRYRLTALTPEDAKLAIIEPGEGVIERKDIDVISKKIISVIQEDGEVSSIMLSLICHLLYANLGAGKKINAQEVENLSTTSLKKFYLDVTQQLSITQRNKLEQLLVKDGRRCLNVTYEAFHEEVPDGDYLFEGKKRILNKGEKKPYFVEVIHDRLAQTIEEAKEQTKQQIVDEERIKIFKHVAFLLSILGMLVFSYFIPHMLWAKPKIYDGDISGKYIYGRSEKAPLTIPSGILNLAQNDTVFPKAFWGNGDLVELHIGDNCYVDDLGFSNCKNLHYLYLDGKNISLYQDVFKGCDNLETIYVSDSCNFRYLGKQSGMTAIKNFVVGSNPNFIVYGENLLVKQESKGKIFWEIVGRGLEAKEFRVPAGDNSYYRMYLKYGKTVLPQLSDSIATDSLEVEYGINWDIQDSRVRPDTSKLAVLVSSDKGLKENQWIINYHDNIVGINFPYIETYHGHFYWNTRLQFVNMPSATSIENSLFSNCQNISSINIPKVISVGDASFQSCNALTRIDLPSVVEIGESAFNACKLLKFINAPKLRIINNSGFRYCESLNVAEFPNATNIGKKAFENCRNLRMISLPSAIFIEEDAFSGCDSLQTIIVSNNISNRFSDKNYCEQIGLTSNYILRERNDTSCILKRVELRNEYYGKEDTINIKHNICGSYGKLKISKEVKKINDYVQWNRFNEIDVEFLNKKYLSFKNVVYSKDTFIMNAHDVKEAFLMNFSERQGIPHFGNQTTSIYIDSPLSDFPILMDSIAKSKCTILMPYGYAQSIRNSLQYTEFKSVDELGKWQTIIIKAQFLIVKAFWVNCINSPIKTSLIIIVAIACVIFLITGYSLLIKENKGLGLYTLLLHLLGIVLTSVLFVTISLNYNWSEGSKINIPLTILLCIIAISIFLPWLIRKIIDKNRSYEELHPTTN